MIEQIDFLIYRLRYLLVGALVASASFFVFWFLIASIAAAVQDKTRPAVNTTAMAASDSPNAITSGAGAAAYGFGQSMSLIGRASSSGLQSVATTTARDSSYIARSTVDGVTFVACGVGDGVVSATNAVGNGFAFVFHIPGNVFGLVANAHVVSAVIRPADHQPDYNPVPVIDPNSPALLAAKQALPATQGTGQGQAAQPTPPPSAQVAWPIHGAITTLFGVPELPYQAIHTGLDISDGKRPGITPVKAYRQGQVIQTMHTGGLGNHVVVDHGNGVTSVYGHLNSISVQVGQAVDISTILGYEGTTGVSTGPHLHFEIRVNGQAADPHLFISGQP